MIRESDYPRLGVLFAGYFNQDWDYGGVADDAEVIAGFVAMEPREYVDETAAELRLLLATDLADAALREVVVKTFSGYYDPGAGAMRNWLERLLELISEAA